MNIIKKHYEKILLAVLLVVFVILLVYLLQITRDANNIGEDDLKIKAPVADYEPVNFREERFYLDKVFAPKIAWVASETRVGGRDPEMVEVSDLMVPVRAAKCPSCERFIPLFRFTVNGVCPTCGVALSMPAKSFSDDADFGSRPSDLDGDGLPNILEDQYDFLSSQNPNDARSDKDNDGFSNLYEYMCGTKLDDGKDHPPLTDLLYIENARPPQFGGTLEEADAATGKAKILLAGAKRPRDISKGNSFSADKRSYTLLDVVDSNTIRLKLNNNDREFLVKKGNPADLPVEIITIMNLGTNRTFEVGVGANVDVGNSVTGKERWKVVALDMVKGTATLDDGDGKTYVIGTEAKIPPRARLK